MNSVMLHAFVDEMQKVALAAPMAAPPPQRQSGSPMATGAALGAAGGAAYYGGRAYSRFSKFRAGTGTLQGAKGRSLRFNPVTRRITDQTGRALRGSSGLPLKAAPGAMKGARRIWAAGGGIKGALIGGALGLGAGALYKAVS